MRRPITVEVRTYRGHQLQLCDDAGDGWILAIYPPHGGASPEMLRTGVPNGLTTLLAAAEQCVDRLPEAHQAKRHEVPSLDRSAGSTPPTCR